MSSPFEEAIRGFRTKLTKAIDVSDLLLGDLLDRRLLTAEQRDQILVSVRCFIVFVV